MPQLTYTDAGAAYSVRAYVTATTGRAPASTSARAHASSVDPVVCTSSTSSAGPCTTPHRADHDPALRPPRRAARARLTARAVAPGEHGLER